MSKLNGLITQYDPLTFPGSDAASVKVDVNARNRHDVIDQKIIFLPPAKVTHLIRKQQNRIMDNLLKKNGLAISNQTQSLNRVNNIIRYISGEEKDKRTSHVARFLLRPTGEYGGQRGEFISHEQEIAVIADWQNHAVLKRPVEDFIIKQVYNRKARNIPDASNYGHLERQLTKRIRRSNEQGELSHESLDFYQNQFLAKTLPIYMLSLEPTEKKILRKMDMAEPDWGFLYAGTKVLIGSGASLDGLSLESIQEVGIMMFTSLLQGAVPIEFARHLELPAFIYHVLTTENARPPSRFC